MSAVAPERVPAVAAAVEKLISRFDPDAIDVPGGSARIRLEVVDGSDFDVVIDLPGAGPPPPPVPVAPQGNNALAIVSLVCGVAQVMLWPLATIPAVVLGHVARHQIRRTGEQGAGLALAGLILGWIGVGFALLAIVGIVLIVAATSGTGG